MSTQRVVAPVLDPDKKLAGPVSYFPSIEKKYGQPVQHWIDLVVAGLDEGLAHMQVVDRLKTDHGMGHGHANAVVGWVRQQLG